MPFLDSLDIANQALQLCGLNPILAVDEDSTNNAEIANAYDKLRRSELQRNLWTFATRNVVLRAYTTTTLTLVPGTYDPTRTYLTGEVAQDANGLFWISAQADNLNNTPGGNNEYWEAFFGPRTVDLYDSTQTYSAGELAYVVTGATPNGYQVYMSLINSNSDTPGTATAWDATVQYKQDDVVSHGGSQWRSLLPINLNNTPATGPLAWAVGTTYSASQTVTGSDNYIYSSVGNGNVGHDPTTDGGVHWTNTGALNAWSSTPTITVSSINWRPLLATLRNAAPLYPVGSGPLTQTGTQNLFHLPVGFLKEAPADPKAGDYSPLGAPDNLAATDWKFQSGYIVSADAGPIVLRFVADITRVRHMHDMFCEGLACRIAAQTCIRLTQSDSKLQEIASAYKLFMGEARLSNAIEAGSVHPPLDDWLACRF